MGVAQQSMPWSLHAQNTTKSYRSPPGVQVGDTFVLNCLGEDTYGPIMKVWSAAAVICFGY